MSMIPGWSDDELRKKHAMEESLKLENDRVLKKQKEENDRLIDALTLKKTKAEEDAEVAQMFADLETKSEYNAIVNEKEELTKLVKDSNVFTKSGKVLLTSRIISALIKGAIYGLAVFVGAGLFFSIIYWIFKVDLIAIVILLVIGAFVIGAYKSLENIIDIFKDSKQIKKTKIYEIINETINNSDLNNYPVIYVDYDNVTFYCNENQDLIQIIFYDKYGYPDLPLKKQVALTRSIQEILEKKGTPYNFDGDIRKTDEEERLLPYKEHWTCKLSLWNKKYKEEKKKEMKTAIKTNKSESNKKSQKRENDLKEGKTW